jgi:hypothetical protein
LILGAANVREQGKTLAELGAEPAAAPASAEFARRNVDSRSADQRRILAALCALGVFISKESLAAIASIPAFEPALQSLLEAKLVQTDGAFYSLSAGVKGCGSSDCRIKRKLGNCVEPPRRMDRTTSCPTRERAA